MKKIVIISPYLYRLVRGIERYTINIADAFINKGYDVIIYTWDNKENVSCGELNPKIKVRKVPYFRWYRHIVATVFYRIWLILDNPQVTLLNFLYQGESHLPKKRRYLYTLHCPASQIPQRYEFIRKNIIAFQNIHLVAVSEMVKKEALPYINNVPISMIYNGTDINQFRPSTTKEESSKLRIITTAALEERKGMHYLIEALADFKYKDQVKYDIYGSGDEQYGAYLAKLIKDKNLQNIVTMKGAITNVAEVLPHYDLFCLLSKGEAFGLSAFEAMACGVPPLVSNYPPYPEFITPDFGRMVDRESISDIQNILSDVIENRDILESMGRNSIKKSTEFSWENIINLYVKIIDNE